MHQPTAAATTTIVNIDDHPLTIRQADDRSMNRIKVSDVHSLQYIDQIIVHQHRRQFSLILRPLIITIIMVAVDRPPRMHQGQGQG